MFEFDTAFNVNTGELDFSYAGSGVHLNKDVKFSFSLLDPMGNIIENDAEMIANPLINEVIFDIIDTGGNMLYPAYESGVTSRSLEITESENESIFGSYNPNFGVRVTVTNKIGTDPFVSEFYTYGNTPIVSNYNVNDGSGFEDYSLSGFWKFNLIESLLTGFDIKTASSGNVLINWGEDQLNIVPDTVYTTGANEIYNFDGSGFTRSSSNLVTADVTGSIFIKGDVISISGITDPISFNGIHVVTDSTSEQFQYNSTGDEPATGAGVASVSITKGAHYYSGIISPVYDKIIINQSFENNLNYVNIEKYDIYASEESLDDIVLFENEKIPSSQNKNFVSSASVQTFQDLYELKILPIGLTYDTPYYFKVVPYSSVGSGKLISFGPHLFKSPPISGEAIASSNQFELIHGDSSMNLDFITGSINNSGLQVIDIIERGIYNTISYTTQIADKNNTIYSSEIKIVDTNNPEVSSGISFSEYAISNNSRVVYSATADQSYIYLHVQNVFPTGIYKLYKTLI
jgi:hypothetical protein